MFVMWDPRGLRPQEPRGSSLRVPGMGLSPPSEDALRPEGTPLSRIMSLRVGRDHPPEEEPWGLSLGASLLCAVPGGSYPPVLTPGQRQVLDLGLQSLKRQAQTCSDSTLAHALSLEIRILQTVGIRGPFVPLGHLR